MRQRPSQCWACEMQLKGDCTQGASRGRDLPGTGSRESEDVETEEGGARLFRRVLLRREQRHRAMAELHVLQHIFVLPGISNCFSFYCVLFAFTASLKLRQEGMT